MHSDGWQRHFFYRKASLTTTWKLRLALFLLVMLIGSMTREFWMLRIGQSLVCPEEIAPSDVLQILQIPKAAHDPRVRMPWKIQQEVADFMCDHFA